MKSKYMRKTNETSQYVYTNDVYDLTISNISGNVDTVIEAKGNDANTVMRQLVEDLSYTTIKLETLMNAFSECIKSGLIPEDAANYLSTYIYETSTKSSKKI